MREQSQQNLRNSYSYCPRKLSDNKLKLLTKPSIRQQTIKQSELSYQHFLIDKNQQIYNICFGEHILVIVTKKGITIYSLLTINIIYQRIGNFWDAKPIPSSNYLLCILNQSQQKRQGQLNKNKLAILDIEKDKFIGTISLTFNIEQIKTAKKCIAVATQKQIAVMHIPSLKPICHEPAGNGLFNIFDLSYQGLTIAYQYIQKGCLIIHNFTNAEITKAQRKNSKSSIINSDKSISKLQLHGKTNKSLTKNLIQVPAHKQRLKTIRISPNGLRIATSSYKGTVIRIFLASTGVLWQQLRVGYQLCKLMDTSYSQQGNILVCLNQNNQVSLFNLKLETDQQKYESQKRGYKIYQQSNPKSFFYFLSIFSRDLGYEHKFAHFKLEKPNAQQETDQNNKDNSALNAQKSQSKIESKQAQNQMEVVFQEQDPQQIQKIKQQQGGQNQQLIQQKPAHIKERQINNQNSEISSSIVEQKMDNKTQKNNNSALERSISDMPVRNSNSFFSKTNKHSIKQTILKKNKKFEEKVYNTLGKIHAGGNNFIWAVKGHYIFMIKYDPFNGGQMHHRQTISLIQ